MRVDRFSWFIALSLIPIFAVPAVWLSFDFVRGAGMLLRCQSWEKQIATINGMAAGHDPAVLRYFHRSVQSEFVEYSYEIDGISYTANRRSAFQLWNFGGIVDDLPGVGRKISVYVNPGDKQEAIIIRSITNGFWVLLVAQVICWLLAASAIVVSFRPHRLVRVLAGYALVALPVAILIIALIADEEERSLRWWIVVGGFMGTLAGVGLSMAVSVFLRRAMMLGALFILAGFLAVFGGAALLD